MPKHAMDILLRRLLLKAATKPPLVFHSPQTVDQLYYSAVWISSSPNQLKVNVIFFNN